MILFVGFGTEVDADAKKHKHTQKLKQKIWLTNGTLCKGIDWKFGGRSLYTSSINAHFVQFA